MTELCEVMITAPDPGWLRSSHVSSLGPATVAQFEVGELAVRPAGRRVGRERGQPVPVGVGQPQLRARVWPLPADDHRMTNPTLLVIVDGSAQGSKTEP